MACVNHPEVPEATRCDRCRRPFCENCFVVVAGQALCAGCKDEAVRRLERGELLSSSERRPSPWERERSFRTLRETLKQSLFKPQEFFRTLDHKGSSAYLSYAVLVAWPPVFLGQLIWLGVQASMMMVGSSGRGEAGVALGFLGLMAGVYFVLTPVGILMQVVVGGGLTHLCLKIVGGANAPFEATLRTFAYMQSSQVFAFVPCLGPLVAWVWGLTLEIVGLREMHETDYGRSVAAALMPAAICCLMAVPLVLLMVLAERAGK